MPTSKLTSSRAFLVLLIAVCLVGLAPVVRPCPAQDMAMSCCEVPEAPAPKTGCCDEPEAPLPPPVEPNCSCAPQPDPTEPSPQPLLVEAAPCWVAAPQASPVPRVPNTRRPVSVPPGTGVGPPIYRLHCVLLI